MAGLSDTDSCTKIKEGIKPSFILVRVTGLEPAHRKIPDPKSGASANSATGALPEKILSFRNNFVKKIRLVIP